MTSQESTKTLQTIEGTILQSERSELESTTSLKSFHRTILFKTACNGPPRWDPSTRDNRYPNSPRFLFIIRDDFLKQHAIGSDHLSSYKRSYLAFFYKLCYSRSALKTTSRRVYFILNQNLLVSSIHSRQRKQIGDLAYFISFGGDKSVNESLSRCHPNRTIASQLH